MFKFAKKDPPYKVSQNVLTTTAQGLDNLYQGVAIGDTIVFGSNAVQNVPRDLQPDARAAQHRKVVLAVRHRVERLQLQPRRNVLQRADAFAIGGVNSGIFNTDSYQVSDDVTLVRGNHQLAVGVNVAYLTMDFLTNARVGGTWIVNGQTTGLGLADFLLGRVSSLEHGAGNLLPMDMWYQGVYAQDTWRASSRVTVNAGLRWEPFFGQSVTNGAIYNWNIDNFRNNVKSEVFLSAPAGLLYPGDEGFPDGKTGLKKQWLNFSPRVGLAWDVHGDGRTAVRTSYGIGYDFPTGERHNINAGAPPWGNRSLLQDPPGGLDDPYSYVGGDPHPIQTSANTEFVTFGAFGATDPDINSPRTQSWNVTLEQQLGSEWGVSVSYLGSYSDRLWTQIQQNPAVFLGTGPCVLSGVSYPVCSTTQNLNQRRELTLSGENPASAALIGNMDLHTSIGTQNYRGLKLSAAPKGREWNLAQRQLHVVALLRRQHDRAASRSWRRTMPTRRTRKPIAATASTDRTHVGEREPGLRDAGSRQRRGERARFSLAGVGHHQRAIGQLAERDHRHGSRAQRAALPGTARQPGQ